MDATLVNSSATPEQFIAALISLAKQLKGQPVAFIADENGKVEIGVLDTMFPDEDAWFFRPVPIEQFPVEVDNQS